MWRRLLSSNLRTLAATTAAASTRSTSIHTRSLISPSTAASLFNLRHFTADSTDGAVKKRVEDGAAMKRVEDELEALCQRVTSCEDELEALCQRVTSCFDAVKKKKNQRIREVESERDELEALFERVTSCFDAVKKKKIRRVREVESERDELEALFEPESEPEELECAADGAVKKRVEDGAVKKRVEDGAVKKRVDDDAVKREEIEAMCQRMREIDFEAESEPEMLESERQLSVVNYPCGPFGTKEKPAIIESFYDKRRAGCFGGDGRDEHDFICFWLEKGKPRECPVCPQYFELKVVGPGGPPPPDR